MTQRSTQNYKFKVKMFSLEQNVFHRKLILFSVSPLNSIVSLNADISLISSRVVQLFCDMCQSTADPPPENPLSTWNTLEYV